MDEDVRAAGWIDRLLPERLNWLSRSTGIPVVFGGSTSTTPQRLVIGRMKGTIGSGLRGLEVRPGSGLGGRVLRDRAAHRVNDYARTSDITHEYDPIVVRQERLTSVFALPITVGDAVCGVLYGAARDHRPVGDRALRTAEVVTAQLSRDVEDRLRPDPELHEPDPLAELAAVIEETGDEAMRARLRRIHQQLRGSTSPTTTSDVTLAPREIEALRLVEIGASNVEIAARLGLSPQTVKTYLRNATRKLAVRNRTAAVHEARLAGLL
ncbi:winged helix-turn-helix transcriptional regulator [Saccharopolyspora terrae]|jgi:DNA-binding CsgD family transcriptional regulator|uniref:Winged helix-turn-helix transcriptional regulator n=1 Tax=Saccharopolyspora terrae TaxID=2530384 RepID=A0A4R4VVK1_9PSEU|nr:LuxR C-terminal-related transcriptional regulator [Saccharopolyspora terrae]TDD10042.1 winged helix-turn-helix transcriptional regulator [Saccharopolyspora terrae]